MKVTAGAGALLLAAGWAMGLVPLLVCGVLLLLAAGVAYWLGD